MQLPVSVREEEDSYLAYCPVFHLNSRGQSMEDALDNIKKDLEKFLDDEKIQKDFHDTIQEYGIRDIEIVDVVVHEK